MKRAFLEFLGPCGQLLLLRAGPEDLPYSQSLSLLAVALTAALHVAWYASGNMGDSSFHVLLYFFGPAGIVGFSLFVLRFTGRLERWPQFALAASVVHLVAGGLVILSSVWLRPLLASDSAMSLSNGLAALFLGLTPIAALFWYGISMARIWASTLDRSLGAGLLVTVLQQIAYAVTATLGALAFLSLVPPSAVTP